jgi:quinol monooxygenase YgiN
MTRLRGLLVTLAGFAGASALLPPAAPAQPLYAVTHVDIAAGGPRLETVVAALREFAADSRKDPGAVRFELLQQDGHPNHFLIYEVWRSRKAFDAHLAAEHTKRFREQVQPVLGSPFRERLHKLMR